MSNSDDDALPDGIGATEGFRAYRDGLSGYAAFRTEVYSAVNGSRQMSHRYPSLGLLNGLSNINGATHGVNLNYLSILHGFEDEDPKQLCLGLLDLQETLDSLQSHLDQLRQAAETGVAKLSEDFGFEPTKAHSVWWVHPDELTAGPEDGS